MNSMINANTLSQFNHEQDPGQRLFKEVIMKPASRSAIKPLAALLAASFAVAVQAQTFNSGSTGADGALSPTVNTEVVLPPSGILNYTTVNIPSGVTVTFRKNTLNTPVVVLVQGDATIAGSININGQPGRAVGSAGDGNQGDDGQPGDGGPGGFTGGRGGSSVQPSTGGAGLGPGAAWAVLVVQRVQTTANREPARATTALDKTAVRTPAHRRFAQRLPDSLTAHHCSCL